MFLPYPLDFQSYLKLPIIWMLIGLNIFGYLVLSEEKDFSSQDFILFKETVISRLGEKYYENDFSVQNPDRKPASHLSTGQKVLLGVQALRDRNFYHHAQEMKFFADKFLNDRVKEEIASFYKIQSEKKSFSLGLNMDSTWMAFLTYQFSHANFIHLLSNMVFLFTLGFYLELILGSLGFLLLFIFAGVAGGVLFNFVNDSSFIPMIGASGSISGLLAFLAISEKRKNIRYVFFLSPLKEHHGLIFAPVIWIIPFYLLSDISSFISTPQGLSSGVAYTAHLGGAIIGILFAILWNFQRNRLRSEQIRV